MPHMSRDEVVQYLTSKVADFAKKAAPMYVALDHTWSSLGRVPNEFEIADKAIDLITTLYSRPEASTFPHWSCSMGGIEVSFTHWPSGTTDAHIKYVAHRF